MRTGGRGRKGEGEGEGTGSEPAPPWPDVGVWAGRTPGAGSSSGSSASGSDAELGRPWLLIRMVKGKDRELGEPVMIVVVMVDQISCNFGAAELCGSRQAVRGAERRAVRKAGRCQKANHYLLTSRCASKGLSAGSITIGSGADMKGDEELWKKEVGEGCCGWWCRLGLTQGFSNTTRTNFSRGFSRSTNSTAWRSDDQTMNRMIRLDEAAEDVKQRGSEDEMCVGCFDELISRKLLCDV